jgi:predicted  nucleic acid-binding Zn-ribbon protein
MRRTIDDLKYSNEEHIKTIHLKDEEVRFLHKEIQTWREVIDKSGDEVTALKEIIADLEDKNRKLNEKLNEIIYNKASAYKQRTLQALRRGESPERVEKADAYGVAHPSEYRLEQVINEEKIRGDRSMNGNSSPLRSYYPD